VILHAFIQPVPEDNSGRTVLPTREVSAEAVDYDEGVRLLRAQLGEGERIIALRVER
jgi:hypothetical protein